MRKIASLCTVLMLLSALVFGQQSRTVSGVVKDDKAQPVPFASVLKQGQTMELKLTLPAASQSKLKTAPLNYLSLRIYYNRDTRRATVDVTLVTKSGELAEVVVTTAFGLNVPKE